MEYDREFNKLSRFARSLVATEKDKVERFLHGLKMSLQKDLSLFELTNHAEALNKALKAEWMREQMNADPKTSEKRWSFQKDHQGNKKGKWTNKKNPRNEKGCKHCGRNHNVKDCPYTTGACFRCGEKGHHIANCPQRAPQKQTPEGQQMRGGNQGGGQRQPPRTQGRLYNMHRDEATNASDVVRGSDDNPLY